MAYLLNSVERGSYRYNRHDDYGHCVVIIFIRTPQDNTEELEDVERVEDLRTRKQKSAVSSAASSRHSRSGSLSHTFKYRNRTYLLN